ncbi:hypothetical protein ACKKBG_A09915 [Auxenochlorella protothecoides x Auxenochlorella symbiontica]|uniref:Large ribosomal subunit protein mL59 domain-containing protein n=1 Tax=Auxenochlorella protothecoides TaxID=3075 RepID=A0A087SQM2_AUXPR|nr:hypothetical protein F751_6701 [Auxenochlorella protothecoides]KFM28026.1 hypothetical protein F751_6701 [Auxenochlorella protothecoides]
MSLQLLRKLGEAALKPQNVGGVWHKAQISAKNVAKLRREALLATGKWEFEPEPKEEKPRKPNKGHKHDRQKPARMRVIAENLAGMDERIEKHRAAKREIKASLIDRLTMTPKQLRQKAKSG